MYKRQGQAREGAGIPLDETRVGDHVGDPEDGAHLGGGLTSPLQRRGDQQIELRERRRRMASLRATQLGQGRVGPTLPATERIPFRLTVTDEQDIEHPSKIELSEPGTDLAAQVVGSPIP